MEIQNSCETSHKVFINNPIHLKSYVQKYVEVKTADGNVHSGTVYTIDPVSERYNCRNHYDYTYFFQRAH